MAEAEHPPCPHPPHAHAHHHRPGGRLLRWGLHSLGGRLCLAFVLSVILALVGVGGIWRYYRAASFEQNSAEQLAAEIRNVLAVAERVGDDPPRLEQAFRAAGLRVRIDPPPPHRGFRARFAYQIGELVSAELGQNVDVEVRMFHARMAEVRFGWRSHQLALELPLGRGERGFPSPFLTVLVLIMLLAAVLGLLSLLWVQRPIQRLAREIASQGDRPRQVDAPPGASDEIRLLVSAYNRMAANIAAREREQEHILAGVSHDLKAPLTRLRMRASLIDDAEISAGIVRDVGSLNHIADQFLGFVRSGQPGMPQTEPTDIAPLARELQARHADWPLALELAPDLPPVPAPPTEIERILENLLDNAREYGHAPISLLAYRAGTATRLAVCDHGPGIPPADLARASEAFVRLDPARGRPGHSGLGLAIVTRLAHQHHGQLYAHTRQDGRFEIGVELAG